MVRVLDDLQAKFHESTKKRCANFPEGELSCCIHLQISVYNSKLSGIFPVVILPSPFYNSTATVLRKPLKSCLRSSWKNLVCCFP